MDVDGITIVSNHLGARTKLFKETHESRLIIFVNYLWINYRQRLVCVNSQKQQQRVFDYYFYILYIQLLIYVQTGPIGRSATVGQKQLFLCNLVPGLRPVRYDDPVM